jgi:hypothetical protein
MTIPSLGPELLHADGRMDERPVMTKLSCSSQFSERAWKACRRIRQPGRYAQPNYPIRRRNTNRSTWTVGPYSTDIKHIHRHYESLLQELTPTFCTFLPRILHVQRISSYHYLATSFKHKTCIISTSALKSHKNHISSILIIIIIIQALNFL